MKKNVIAPLAAISVLATPAAAVAATDQEIEDLRMQLAAVSERLEALAAENAELRRAQDQTQSAIADVEAEVSALELPEGAMAKDAWPSRIKFDGDFRYRHEEIDAEGSSTQMDYIILMVLPGVEITKLKELLVLLIMELVMVVLVLHGECDI